MFRGDAVHRLGAEQRIASILKRPGDQLAAEPRIGFLPVAPQAEADQGGVVVGFSDLAGSLRNSDIP